ncbi:MAG TPA: hypothetical protein DCQ93_00575 [Bacteroidetes bacterium]|nr:hypothetical protein [Bacteroidota bacterium]
MKKTLILFSTAFLFAICLSSCGKKDYVCNCTMSGTTLPYSYDNSTHKEAENGCAQKETEFINGGHTDAQCELAK